jgi:DNA-binding CsgD family transcriptional regulator
VAIHTGDERQKRETAALARAMVADGTPAERGHGGWLLALGAMADGNPAGARAMLEASGLGAPGGAQLYPVDVTDAPQLVRIALASGDSRLAADTVASARERARRNPGIATVRAAAAHALGLREADAASLGQACLLLDGGPRPMALASALEDLGVTQLRTGAPAAGVDTLGRALVRYTEIGATWDARRVRGRLRANGVRRRLVTSARPDAGWSALTDSELAVVRLIAHGLTNRETAVRLFISPHTVSSHLRHAFTKLGINSRLELARVVAAHTGDPAGH